MVRIPFFGDCHRLCTGNAALNLDEVQSVLVRAGAGNERFDLIGAVLRVDIARLVSQSALKGITAVPLELPGACARVTVAIALALQPATPLILAQPVSL